MCSRLTAELLCLVCFMADLPKLLTILVSLMSIRTCGFTSLNVALSGETIGTAQATQAVVMMKMVLAHRVGRRIKHGGKCQLALH